MSNGKAIQVAVTHTAVGIFVGSLIEAVLPAFSADAALATQIFEALVQVGLNGIALTTVSSLLSEQDPTFGIPFSMSLYMAQPTLTERIAALSAQVKAQVAQAVQQTGVRSTSVPVAN